MVHQKPAWRQLEFYLHFNLSFWSHLYPQFLSGFWRLFCFGHPAVPLWCRIFLEILGRYLMKVLMGPVITVMFCGAGRRNNSIWKLSSLLSLFMWKIWHGQISAVFQVWSHLWMQKNMFFCSSLEEIIKTFVV